MNKRSIRLFKIRPLKAQRNNFDKVADLKWEMLLGAIQAIYKKTAICNHREDLYTAVEAYFA